MFYQWKKKSDADETLVNKVSETLGVNTFYANLLANRGIITQEKANQFFNPDLDALHDPFLMKGVEEAVDRIDAAVQKDQKVWIYGDYDVDGTTSVALVFDFLRQFIADIEYYIPNRETEGYGLSQQAVDLAIEKKVNLIITLDCGIRSVDLVSHGKSNNIDFIICDHHEVGAKLPEAVAVLDAKQNDCGYPYKELSACGVGFKLVQALCVKWELPDDMALDYLDLVAVSIASDLVPITGENRVLAYQGLQKLASNPSKGLKTIMDRFMNSASIDITNVVFMIGPRINAAGRISSGTSAVKLLLADTDLDAEEMAEQLNSFNLQRRELDKTITTQALDMLATDITYHSKKTTVVYNPNWHKGVVGIVASRLLENHYKPTIVLTQSGEKIVGSARSIQGFDIHDALEKCSDHLIQFGGHKFAAGMTLRPDQLDGFKVAFEGTASHLSEEDLTPTLDYELELNLSSISQSLYDNLKRFAPFGPGNMKPLFVTRSVRDSGSLRTMGSDHSHLKLNLISDDQVSAIGATAFGFGRLYNELKTGKPFDVLYTLEENHFRGQTKLELMVKDIRLR